jgi:CheY-like chemotaxis protein
VSEKRDCDILFVDDEWYFAARYVEKLRESFEVAFLDQADEVVPFLDKNPKVKLMVLDIMMPGDDLDTRMGLDTGLCLLERIQSQVATWPFPVMVLTNRKMAEIEQELTARKKKIAAKTIEVRQKLDTPAFAIVDLVKDLMKRVGYL